jgi:methylase of polypeptide subunit release factors
MNQLSAHIKNTLEYLDFQFNQVDYSSVYFVTDLDSEQNLHPKIVLDLDRAKMFEADAVYFRFFDSNRLPQPQIYIYDNTIKSNEPDYFARIHRNIWSASEISIFMVVEKSSIKVYDSRIPVTIKNNLLSSKPIEIINIEDISEYNQALKLYNAKLFDNGSFWESDEADKHFLSNKTAYEKLITGLKSVRNSFNSQSNLSPELSDHILILSVLVKYLEENGIDESGINLAHQFFLESVGYSSFVEIIRNNRLVDLFDKLSIHFNGGIFQLSTSQNEELLSANFETLTRFLEGTLVDQSQLVLWEEYSFKHIPIELISNFYEELLPKVKKADKEKKQDTGAVYTPGFLVNFLVDECLPLTTADLNENVKLIDVSCGSGIFLVTAYKRLVQRWRIANRRNGILANATPTVLQQILLNNIFGVDIDKNAAELTTFSLNLSLCSMLTPKQIWTELRFDDLNKNGNVIQKDFFDYLIENKPNNFDLVIGNPPFKSLGDEEYARIEGLMCQNALPLTCKIPDKQFALIFLDKAMDLLMPNALLCLIMPSGPLLYNNTLAFRSTFFEKYNIPQIIDFTFLRNTLFEHANVAVASIFVQKRMPDVADILHITIKRTRANKEKNYFEIDHYDFHDVPKQVAKTVDFVWKSNLIGGGRIYNLIDKFTDKSIRTLKVFLQKRKRENNWDFGQGYIVGSKNKKFLAEYITGKPTVVDKYFTEEKGIQKIEIQEEILFKDRSRQIVFEPPHLLIKKTIGKKTIPFELRYDYLTFKNEIIGIHCPENEITELERLTANMKKNNQFYRFYVCATSARSGISRSIYTSLTEDFFNLPYPENDLSFSLSDCVLIEDTVNYFIPFFELGENAEISKIISDHKVFNDFSEIYCQALNSIYKESNKQYSLSKVYEGNAFYACEYIFGDKTSTPEYRNTEADFSDLINHWSGRNALIKRVLRIYSDNKIILVKPKQLRYWLKSIALRDVDETLNESFEFNA